MSRVVILTFFSKERWDSGAHPHESPILMWLPMAILAIGSIASGFLFTSGNALQNWLAPVVASDHKTEHSELLPPAVVSTIALVLVAIGVAIAIMKYRAESNPNTPENVSIFTRIARKDLMQDAFNEAVFMRPGQALTKNLVSVDENLIDGAVNGVGGAAVGSGQILRKLQSGFVRSYAAMMLVGIALLLLVIWVVTQ
jgi:NADH-quinone oxidoreductase subunit L